MISESSLYDGTSDCEGSVSEVQQIHVWLLLLFIALFITWKVKGQDEETEEGLNQPSLAEAGAGGVM